MTESAGFVDAYDPASGKRLWRFYTIPARANSATIRGRATVGKRVAAPPGLNRHLRPRVEHTLFWPVGNPGPDINGDVRKGDNLFTCAVVALDPDTGQRKWHYPVHA